MRDGRSLEGPLATGLAPPSSLPSNRCHWVNICPTRIWHWSTNISQSSCPSPQFLDLSLPISPLQRPPAWTPDVVPSPSLTEDFPPSLLPFPTLTSPSFPLTLCSTHSGPLLSLDPFSKEPEQGPPLSQIDPLPRPDCSPQGAQPAVASSTLLVLIKPQDLTPFLQWEIRLPPLNLSFTP